MASIMVGKMVGTPSQTNLVEPAEAAALVRTLTDEGYRQWEKCFRVAKGGDENLPT
jgi:hypothetical protein